MADISISQQLYQYLCGKVGTETVFKARRTFFKVNDCLNIKKSTKIETISSGSKAEGLDLPGSDLDLMLMAKKPIIKSKRGILLTTTYEFILDTSTNPPGYAYIEIYPATLKHCIFINGKQYETENLSIENKQILLNTKFKHFRKHLSSEIQSSLYVIHGPCTSELDESVDYAFCFRLEEWPAEALDWIHRPRVRDWPSETLITNIFQEEKSVLLVPIGSKCGSSEDNPCEWRISFSVAEKMLVHSLNHTQIICYAMLKILLKQVIEKKFKSVLCSYFMKTLLFWMVEETGSSLWTPNNLFKCFQACIARLSYHVEYEYFPHYFILQNNMFEGRMTRDSKSKLYCFLQEIYIEGIDFTLRTESLQDFKMLNIINRILNENVINCHDKDKAIYPLLQYLRSPRSLTRIYYYLTKCKSVMVKTLLFLQFVACCQNKAIETKYNFHKSNKNYYKKYKSLVPYFVFGTKSDLNGWLPLAAFFYQNKHFCNALKISTFVCSEMPKRINIIDGHQMRFCSNTQTYQYIFCEGSSLLQRIKSLCVIPVTTVIEAGTVFDNCDLNIDMLLFQCCIFDESLSKFGHFMNFMCLHHLHDKQKEMRALHDLQHAVDNVSVPQLQQFGNYLLLNIAYRKANIPKPHRNNVDFLEGLKEFFHIPGFGSLVEKLCRKLIPEILDTI